jgi:putative transposase
MSKMETMERKKPRPRRSFTPEFKAEIIEVCQRGDLSIGQVARDFDLTETNVRSWVKQAEIDQGECPGLTTEERAKLTKLRRENRSLREDVEILKRATAFLRSGDPVKVDPFVEAEKSRRSQRRQGVGLLEVSRSAYYQRRNGVPSQRKVTDAELTKQIAGIFKESNGTYGSPRIHKELGHRQVACGRRRVTRLMRAAGLEGRCKKRWHKTTVPDPGAELARDLIARHFGPSHEMDRRYVGDITYIATWEGWSHLATVIDLASRRVVGWALADHMRTELVEDALKAAFANRAPELGVIFHSAAVNTPAVTSPNSPATTAWCSRSEEKGECWDNAVAGSNPLWCRADAVSHAGFGLSLGVANCEICTFCALSEVSATLFARPTFVERFLPTRSATVRLHP